MPKNKEALIRYRLIDQCLRNKYRPFPTMDDFISLLEEKLGKTFSVSTVQKDIKAMKEDQSLGFMAPISFHRGHRGYYYTDEHYTVASIPLNFEDISAMDFAAVILDQFTGIPIFEQYGNAVDKIKEAIDITKVLGSEKEVSFIQFEKVTYQEGSHWLPQLIESIKNRIVLNISHQKFESGELLNYILHGYLLKEYRNRWYLTGMIEPSMEIRIFGLDRIREIQLTELEYKWHPKFNPGEFFKYAYGISIYDSEPLDIILSFKPLAGKYIKTQPLHQSQEILKDNNRELRIRLKLYTGIEFKMVLLSYGENVKVLEPASLAEEIRATAIKMASLYS